MMLRRTLVAVAALAALAACTKDKNVQPPSELVEINPTLEVRKLWSTSVGSGEEKLRLALGIAVDGDTVYAAARDGKVTALEAGTGKTRWKAEAEDDLSAGPSVGGGLVVVGSTSGRLIAFEAATGKQRWVSDVQGEVLAAPLVTAERVVARLVDGRLRALDPANGKEVWMAEDVVPRLSLRGTSPPVRAGDAVLCGFDTGRVMSVALSNGDILWQAQLNTPRGRTELERLADVDAAVAVAGEEVYAVGYQGRIAMIALDTGQLWWTRDMSSYRGVAIDDDQLYVSTSDGGVVALRRRDGSTAWQQGGLMRRTLSAPAVHLGAVVVGDYEGYLHWMDRSSGRFVARERPGSTRISASPIVVGDRLFVIDDDGKVAAFGGGGARR